MIYSETGFSHRHDERLQRDKENFAGAVVKQAFLLVVDGNHAALSASFLRPRFPRR